MPLAPDTVRATIQRLLGEDRDRLFILRDTGDTDYPRQTDLDLPPPERKNRWRARRVVETGADAMTMRIARHHAWFDPATGQWDCANVWNLAVPSPAEDPWNGGDLPPSAERIAAAAAGPHHAWFDITGPIPFARIVAIDEAGDGLSPHVHLFVDPAPATGYAYDRIDTGLVIGTSRPMAADPQRRIAVFDPADRLPL